MIIDRNNEIKKIESFKDFIKICDKYDPVIIYNTPTDEELQEYENQELYIIT